MRILFFFLLLPALALGQLRPGDGTGTGTGSGASLSDVTNVVSGSMTNVGTNFLVPRTTFVGTNGVEAAALIERPDRPFLNLSNAVRTVTNNWTLDVRPGLYTVPTWGFYGTGALNIVRSTNIVIEGNGSTVQAGGLGTVWTFTSCENVIVRNFNFIGVRTNGALIGQHGMFWGKGTNRQIRFEYCTFKNMDNFGWTFGANDEGNAIHYDIDASFCTFDNIGSTNSGVLIADGCAFLLSSGSDILNCNFNNDLRPLEAYSSIVVTGPQTISDVNIIGCNFDGTINAAIYNIATNAPRWKIANCHFKAYDTNRLFLASQQWGIQINAGKDWDISGNDFTGLDAGIYFKEDSASTMEDMSITGNNFTNMVNRAILCYKSSGIPPRRILVAHNTIHGTEEWGIYAGMTDSAILFNTWMDTGKSGSGGAIAAGYWAWQTNLVIAGNIIGNAGTVDYTPNTIDNNAGSHGARIYGNIIQDGQPAIINAGTNSLNPEFPLGGPSPGLTPLATNTAGRWHWAEKTAYLGPVTVTNGLTVSNLTIFAGENYFVVFTTPTGDLIWSNNAAGLLLRYDATASPAQWRSPQLWESASNSVLGSLLASIVNVTNKVTYQNLTVSGAGTGSTNYTLLSGRTMYLGSSNVNISAVMDYGAVTTTEYSSVAITNLSANTWGLSFSSVTNRWFFQGTYGTNAPAVLTNNTRLELSFKHKGTNTWVGYTYYAPAQ